MAYILTSGPVHTVLLIDSASAWRMGGLTLDGKADPVTIRVDDNNNTG